jgi:hypothetical protein
MSRHPDLVARPGHLRIGSGLSQQATTPSAKASPSLRCVSGGGVAAQLRGPGVFPFTPPPPLQVTVADAMDGFGPIAHDPSFVNRKYMAHHLAVGPL